MSKELVIVNCTLLTDPYSELLTGHYVSIRDGCIEEVERDETGP